MPRRECRAPPPAARTGNALKELGDVEAAVSAYLKAIQLKPRYPDVYNNLAVAYAQLGDTEQVRSPPAGPNCCSRAPFPRFPSRARPRP